MDVKRGWRSAAALLLCVLLSFCALSVPVRASGTGETKPPVNFMSYEAAVACFDFDTAAANWCSKFGLDPVTKLGEARQAILAGTDPALIIGLATFARDTGHGGEKLVVTNAFRPACYQEALGLHDYNRNTGPYRKAMTWNGRNVVDFWWNAENAPGWPDRYSIDLRAYDLQALDLDIFYRAALRLWDNGWVGNYYARPGCSSHNSGTAVDLSNYWIATNFATVYEYNGVKYDMADYGIYKPLQPTASSAGEAWHITSAPAMLGMGNYDAAFASGFETVYGMYYNPAILGWNMDGGWSLYLGAGVAVLQIRLCQLGLLDAKYVTGYYCTHTHAAMREFQAQNGLAADGICGGGTLARLMPEKEPVQDAVSPVLIRAEITQSHTKGFRILVSGRDDQRLNAYRVDTRLEGQEEWVTRYYNATLSGETELDVDLWAQGNYEVRAAACDAAGNESELYSPGTVYHDTTAPELRCLTVSDIGEDGFVLTAKATDNVAVAGFRVRLTSAIGTVREDFYDGNGYGAFEIRGVGPGTWTLAVTAVDVRGNESGYTFDWKYTQGAGQPGVSVTHYGG